MRVIYSLYVTTRKSHWLLRKDFFFQNRPYSAIVFRGSYHPHLFPIHATKTGCPSSPWPPMTAPWGIPDWRLFGTQLNVVLSASSYTRNCYIKTIKIGNELLMMPIMRRSTNKSSTNISQCYKIVQKTLVVGPTSLCEEIRRSMTCHFFTQEIVA